MTCVSIQRLDCLQLPPGPLAVRYSRKSNSSGNSTAVATCTKNQEKMVLKRYKKKAGAYLTPAGVNTQSLRGKVEQTLNDADYRLKTQNANGKREHGTHT